MRLLKRIAFSLICLVGGLAIVVFVLENSQATALTILGWSAPPFSVAIMIVVALLVGMVVGPLLSWAFGAPKQPKKPNSI